MILFSVDLNSLLIDSSFQRNDIHFAFQGSRFCCPIAALSCRKSFETIGSVTGDCFGVGWKNHTTSGVIETLVIIKASMGGGRTSIFNNDSA